MEGKNMDVNVIEKKVNITEITISLHGSQLRYCFLACYVLHELNYAADKFS